MNRINVEHRTMLCLLGGVLSILLAQSVFGQWDMSVVQFHQAGGTGHDYGNAILLEDYPYSSHPLNMYVVGAFSGTDVLFGYTTTSAPVTLSSKGGRDVFVIKYDNSGRILWARSFGSTGDDDATSIARALPYYLASKNIWVAGFYSGTITLDNSATYPSQGETDLFVVEFSPDGDILNFATAGGPGADVASGVAAISDSGVWVTGWFSDSCRFNQAPGLTPLSLTSAGSTDIYMARVSGSYWTTAVRAGGVDSDIPRAIAIDLSDPQMRMYITGSFGYPSVTFGTTTLNSAGGKDIFVASFDTSGNMLWANRAGGPGDDEGRALLFPATIYFWHGLRVTGLFSNTAVFGTTTLVSAGSTDIFYAEWDSTGPREGANRYGGPGTDVGAALASRAISAMGEREAIVLAGTFEQTAGFGNDTVTSAGGSDIFVMGMGGLARAGGPGNDGVHGLALSWRFNCYLTGGFEQTARFGDTTGTSTAMTDSYVLTTAEWKLAQSVAKWLVFGTQPTATSPGQVVTPPVTVRIVDADWNLVASDNRMVTVTDCRNYYDFYRNFGSSRTVGAIGGIATFNGLAYSEEAPYRLVATATNLYSDVSDEFLVAVPTIPGPNIIVNGDFESGISPWTYYENGGAGNWFDWESASPYPTAGYRARIELGDTVGTNNQLFQGALRLSCDSTYRLTFQYFSRINTDFRIALTRQDNDTINYGINNVVVSCKPVIQIFRLDFSPRGFTGLVNDATLRFLLNDATHLNSIILDNVVMSRNERIVEGIKRDEISGAVPKEVHLLQNYPNPFNASTVVRYALPNRAHVRIAIMNVLGQEVAILVDGEFGPGYHEVKLDSSRLASGVYFYRMETGNFTQSKKFCLIK
jgi:hypothetical protein